MVINRNMRPQSTGTILIVALVVLTFVLLLGGVLARTVFIFRQQAQVGERRQQAMLLAESAIQRALRAVSIGSEYQGETWHVPAEMLSNGSAGVVVIRVEKSDESAMQRSLSVEAVYPEQGTQRFVYRRELLIDLTVPSVAAALRDANPSAGTGLGSRRDPATASPAS